MDLQAHMPGGYDSMHTTALYREDSHGYNHQVHP